MPKRVNPKPPPGRSRRSPDRLLEEMRRRRLEELRWEHREPRTSEAWWPTLDRTGRGPNVTGPGRSSGDDV